MKSSRSISSKSSKSRLPSIVVERVQDVTYQRSWAIYGRSGTGKTTFVGTFPAPILLIDLKDRGTDSVADVKDLFVARLKTFEEIEEVYYNLLEDPDYADYKTIVIDTVTQMQDIVLRHVMAKRKGVKEADLARAGDWGTLTMREWGAAAGIMKDWLTNYRDLEREVVFLAQERVNKEEGEDEETLAPDVGPRLMPSVVSVLNANVSVIANTFIRRKPVTKEEKGRKITKHKTVYCMRVGPNPIYVTKLRKPKGIVPPEYVEDPQYEDILSIIRGD